MTEIETLEQGIAALEAQRGLLGAAVVDAMLAPVREKLAALKAAQSATAVPPAAQQRKHVTVLFADLPGFTALAEHMDAEDVAALINALWKQLDAAISAQGGLIDKHIGDAVMALWGVDRAREDDPERAIHAALAMQSVLAEWRMTQGVEAQTALAMRIGINTGPVLLGAVGATNEFTALGDTVNTASRLEHAAPVGGVLIAHDTYRHVRGVFDVQQLAPLRVKGKAEPLIVYLVERAKPRTFRLRTRGVEGIETRTVGRARELKWLQGAWHVALTAQCPQAALVIGEAGVGKSRLLYELLNWMEARANLADWEGYADKRFWLFRGHASAELAHTPYALLRDVFMTRFQILEGDSIKVAHEKFVCGTITLLPGDPQAALKAEFIGHVLGFDFSESAAVREALSDPRQLRDRAFLYIEQLFFELGQTQPIALLLEDLHWADDDSLAWVEALLRATTTIPLFTVGVARPILFERRPGWLADDLFVMQVPVGPLSQADSHALVDEILQKVDAVPPILRELIVSRAEGNPFYMEELIKMLIDQRVFLPQADADEWRIDLTRLAEAAVPATLTGVLQARLDHLAAAERVVLQRAAVIGRIFWAQAVKLLGRAGDATQAVAEDVALAALEQKEFVFTREESTFIDTVEYVFKHALLRDVTYETVLKSQRRAYHAMAAHWLTMRVEQQSALRAEALAGLIAEHHEKAGEPELAARWYLQAGEAAQAAYANAAARDYYERWLALRVKSEQRGALLLKLGAVLQLSGAWAEAEARYREALAEAETAEDRVARAHCQQSLGELARECGEYEAALSWLEQAWVSWETVGDAVGALRTLNEVGVTYKHQANYGMARTYLEQSLAEARVLGHEASIALALQHLGVMTTDSASAQTLFAESLMLNRKLGQKKGIADSLANLAILAFLQGNSASAQTWHEESLALRQEIGDKLGIALSLNYLGVLALSRGEYMEAHRLHQESFLLQQAMGAKQGQAGALNNLGIVALEQGEFAQAHTCYLESLVLFEALGDRFGLTSVRFNLGLVAFEQLAFHEAYAQHRMSLTLASEIGDQRFIAYNLSGLAAVATSTGDWPHTARLAAAAETLLAAIGGALEPFIRRRHTRTMDALHAALAADALAEAWAAGTQMTLAEAVTAGLQALPGNA